MTTPSVPPIALAGEPDCKLVPTTLTPWMATAFTDYWNYKAQNIYGAWAAMLDAAPSPSASSVPVAMLSAEERWSIASRVHDQCVRLGSCATFRSAASQAINDTLDALDSTREAEVIADYEDVLSDHRRLVRELDVLLNGESGAAKQASLCDIVAQVRKDRSVMTTPSVPPIALAGEPVAITEKMINAGLMALVQCTASELEDYSPKLMEGYIADVTRVFTAMHIAAPSPSASSDASKFLSESDMAALFVFHSQMEDHEADGYTVDKEKMKRLAELGVVNSRGFGRYETTAFGAWLVETDFEQNPTLPLRTVAEHNERALLRANGATK